MLGTSAIDSTRPIFQVLEPPQEIHADDVLDAEIQELISVAAS